MGWRPPSQPARQERPPRRSMARESSTTLLPTKSSTASIFLASAMCFDRSRRSISQRSAPNFSSMEKRSRLRVVAITRACAFTAILSAAWPNDDVAPRMKKLALFDLEIAEQTGPGGRVSFRNCRQLGPRQIRLNKRDIRGRRASVLSVAAVYGSTEPAHQRGNRRYAGKFAARAGFHEAYTFYAPNRRRLGPLTTPHMYLGMVDSKGLDLDDDVTCLGFRLRDVLVDQAVQPAELL